MRVLFFGTYDASRHPRVRVLQEGFADHGDEVLECVEPLNLNTAARVRALNSYLFEEERFVGRRRHPMTPFVRSASTIISALPAASIAMLTSRLRLIRSTTERRHSTGARVGMLGGEVGPVQGRAKSLSA